MSISVREELAPRTLDIAFTIVSFNEGLGDGDRLRLRLRLRLREPNTDKEAPALVAFGRDSCASWTAVSGVSLSGIPVTYLVKVVIALKQYLPGSVNEKSIGST